MPPIASPRRRLPLAALGLAAGAVVFALGIAHLFQLRFSLGDVYPPYSTLRTDPLGAKAIYEALAAQPALSVERNLRPLDQLARPAFAASATRDRDDDNAPAPALTVFYLGADTYDWPFLLEPDAVERLETLMRRGGRVVLTFGPAATPLTVERLKTARREAENPTPSPTPAARGKPASPTPAPAPTSPPHPGRAHRDAAAERPDLILRWSIDFRRRDPGARDHPGTRLPAPTAANHAHAAPADGVPILDPTPLSWHSVTDFDLAGDAGARGAGWRALYACEGRPVIVARPFGGRGGELILCGDSYFLSNEALRAEPHPPLLAALVGPARRVVFDEFHLGISEHPGLVTLARRYRLQGALAALGLLAALFVWRNVVSLVPPATGAADGDESSAAVLGRDSAAGFLNLLRRGVPARELPAVCLARWEQTGQGPAHAPTLERLRAVVQADDARPPRQRAGVAATYRAMCATVRKKM